MIREDLRRLLRRIEDRKMDDLFDLDVLQTFIINCWKFPIRIPGPLISTLAQYNPF